MITYSREKKELIIPTGFNPVGQEDCSAAIEEARTEGYDEAVSEMSEIIAASAATARAEGVQEGIPIGAAQQKALLEGVTFNDNGVYNRENGWNQVIVNVHCSGTPEPSLQQKEIVVDNFYHYVGGKIVVTPDLPYDGLSAVTVSAVTTNEVAEIINNNLVVTEGYIQDSILEAGSAITITENGIYTPSGSPINRSNIIYQFPNSAGTNDVALHWQIPNYFKSIEVNVTIPHWNNYCSGTFRTDTTKVWSTADENEMCFFDMMFPVNTFDHLKVDNVALEAYCTGGYTMQAGQHTFLLDMDGLRDDPEHLWEDADHNEKSFHPVNEFPNLDGNITYYFYREQIQ